MCERPVSVGLHLPAALPQGLGLPLRCSLVDCPGKVRGKISDNGDLGLKPEYASLGVQDGYQRMEDEEKGREKVGKLDLICAQFSPLSPR